MFLNIIFFATLYPVLFIICIVFALQNSYKDGMLFAVNMKREWVEDENVFRLAVFLFHTFPYR